MKKTKIAYPDDHFEVITSIARSVLAPSKKLIKSWKKVEKHVKSGNGPTRRISSNNLTIEFHKHFRGKYVKEIRDSKEANKRIGELIELSKTQTVWLVCYEKEYPCHRFILEDIIKRRIYAEELNIRRFERVEPKYGVRHLNIIAPEANADGTCARPECNNERPKSKQKYCSGECAQLSFWERNWDGFKIIAMVRDDYKCVICGCFVYLQWFTGAYIVSSKAINGLEGINPDSANSDYEFAFLKLMKKYSTSLPAIYRQEWVSKMITHEGGWQFDEGYYKEIPKHLKKANTDHIIPISKGGASLDLDNLQTLCEDDHRKKTKNDLSTPVSRKRRADKEARLKKINENEKSQKSLSEYYD